MKTYKNIFSPTGGTAAAADALTKKWLDTKTIDLSVSGADYGISLDKNALTLIAMPSFGGIAPQLALDRLAAIRADGAKCAVAAVYGNRAYDDTLIQMKDYAEKQVSRLSLPFQLWQSIPLFMRMLPAGLMQRTACS